MHTLLHAALMPADFQKDTRLSPAATAQPNLQPDQGQDEATVTSPPTSTNPHPTATPAAPWPTEGSSPVPNGAVEHGAASRVGSTQTEGAIGIAARAGPGAFSPAAPASDGSTAVDAHIKTCDPASSGHVPATCSESSEPDAHEPQTADVRFCQSFAYAFLSDHSVEMQACCCLGCKVTTLCDGI